MEIQLKEITVGEITNGFSDNNEEGIVGYGGKLNIRPQYQREFVYKPAQRDAVIRTINKNFPLNVMYWAKNGEDSYEILDGQQRTVSFCQYVNGLFSLDGMYFHNLSEERQQAILNYKLFIYICEGTADEKLGWFETINIAGEKLTDQELRNAVYVGPWLSDAKHYFSKTCCIASKVADGYISKSTIRQELLEQVLRWISYDHIVDYMATHQFDNNCNELWQYFNAVITWAKSTFRDYYKEMKGIEWGNLYNKYKDADINPSEISKKVKELMTDDEVQNKKGIFEFVLSGEYKLLNLRTFRESEKRSVYEKQNGICPICGNHFEYSEAEADHIIPWSKGGKTNISNLQVLCKKCNREKSDKY